MAGFAPNALIPFCQTTRGFVVDAKFIQFLLTYCREVAFRLQPYVSTGTVYTCVQLVVFIVISMAASPSEA